MKPNSPAHPFPFNSYESQNLNYMSIATHCNTAGSSKHAKLCPSLAVQPSSQVKQALELGWVTFGLAFAKSEAISQSVITAKLLGGLSDRFEYPAIYQEMIRDTATLSDGDLRNKYPLEYNSHRNAKAAPKTRAIAFDPRLIKFRNFLRHMGPCPADPDSDGKKRFTLERVKGKDSPYKIGNLEWASKRKQTGTRKVTRWHKLEDGTSVTTKQLAKRAGKTYNTVYKQLASGKEPEKILAHVPTDLMSSWIWPHHLQMLEESYKKRAKQKQSRLTWAIELFQNYLEVARYEDMSDPQMSEIVEKLNSELSSLESERTRIIKQMKHDKKSEIINFALSIKDNASDSFLSKALPSTQK